MKTEFQKAWETFKDGTEGAGCLDSGILHTSEHQRFLENRLWRAFGAGWRAQIDVSEPAQAQLIDLLRAIRHSGCFQPISPDGDELEALLDSAIK